MTSNQRGAVPEQHYHLPEDPGMEAQRAYKSELAQYQRDQARYESEMVQFQAQQARYEAELAQYEAQPQAHAAQLVQAVQYGQRQYAPQQHGPQYLTPLHFVDPQRYAAPQYADSAYYTGKPLVQVWTPPVLPHARESNLLLGLTVTGIILAGGALALVLVYLVAFLGPVALIVATVMALVPLIGILFAVRWIDRWEPEPRAALWFAFLWGAGVSVAIALIFDFGKQIIVYASGLQANAALDSFLGSTVQAPIVEEFGKGLGILIIFWVFRKSFNGPVDGVVYAATIAAGFAFTENIQYLGTAMIEGGVESSIQLWLIRCLMSPFAHVLFTVCTGLALGFASRKSSAFGAIGWFMLGWAAATMGHAFWNGSMFFIPNESAFFGWYFATHVPMIILCVVVVVFLRRSEARQTWLMLHDYQQGGWFTPQEVTMLATGAGRSSARKWAASQGPVKKAAMKKLILDATHLAQARQRIIAGFRVPVAVADERALLQKVAAHRAVLTA